MHDSSHVRLNEQQAQVMMDHLYYEASVQSNRVRFWKTCNTLVLFMFRAT